MYNLRIEAGVEGVEYEAMRLDKAGNDGDLVLFSSAVGSDYLEIWKVRTARARRIMYGTLAFVSTSGST